MPKFGGLSFDNGEGRIKFKPVTHRGGKEGGYRLPRVTPSFSERMGREKLLETLACRGQG